MDLTFNHIILLFCTMAIMLTFGLKRSTYLALIQLVLGCAILYNLLVIGAPILSRIGE